VEVGEATQCIASSPEEKRDSGVEDCVVTTSEGCSKR